MFIIYMKYLPGNIFVNTTITGFSECFACVTAYFLYNKLGPKLAVMTVFIISFIGAILLIFLKDYSKIVPVLVLLCKYGNGAAFAMAYFMNFDFFPTIFVSTSYGIC